MNATITVLAHKMDLVSEEERQAKINRISEIFFLDSLEQVIIYGTSIFEDSVFDVMKKVSVEKA